MLVRLKYLALSNFKKNYVWHFISIWCTALLSFVILLDVTGIRSYLETLRMYDDNGVSSVVWYRDDTVLFGSTEASITEDYREKLKNEERKQINESQYVNDIVAFNVVRFDFNDSVLVLDNNYFDKYYDIKFDSNSDTGMPQIILNEDYKGKYNIGDIYRIETLEYIVSGFEDTYILLGDDVIKPDGIFNEFKYDETKECNFWYYIDNSAIIPEASIKSNEFYQYVRTILIFPIGIKTSQESKANYIRLSFYPSCYLALLFILCVTLMFIVIYSRLVVCLFNRRRIMAIYCICGATWKECVWGFFIVEFFKIIVGFCLGTLVYKHNASELTFIDPLSAKFQISNMFISLLFVVLVALLILLPSLIMERKNSIVDMMRREEI